MSLNIRWSDRLEVMAEQLFASWEAQPTGNPFARTAIVVDDMATRSWLQDYFLFRRENTRTRKVLANIDFVPLAEFVNDWLAAQTHKDTRMRNANEHPYSKNVLAWRINAALGEGDADSRLNSLYAYVWANEKLAEKRAFELSTRIAQLYDDYITYRPELLAAWEGGSIPDGVDAWQGVLYQKLVAQCPLTYSKDYAEALDETADLETAYQNGFPRYEAVHVFDVAFAPKPFLDFLERISRKLPTTFWNFNPVRGTWDKKELLLGALASHADGVLDYERGVCRDGLRWVGSETNYETFCNLKKVEVHACHSPRRELEALRNGLQDFFAQNEYAQPKDVLVLCADWATYSPLVEAVFGTPGDAGYIPVALKGSIAEESPIKHAFSGLLDFKDNKFEVSAVVNLLSVPSVRRKFEIEVDELGLLRDMIQEANIHWGYDDEPDAEPRPFTWRRGLDRLALDALMGERENPDTLETAGALGRIRPCGHVEGDRATAVGKLDVFVRKLNDLKTLLNGEYDFEGWRDVLTILIDDFFASDDAELEELAELRRAVATAARDIRSAWYYAGINDVAVSAEVYIAAVLAKIKDTRPHEPVSGDSVTFASLTSGAATPAKFVWICGLNDGTFPKDGTYASFDFVGREPRTPFDVTPRDKDLFAFMKATFGAREQLALSYVGKNVRSNEDVPPSVSLVDFVEWFSKTERGKERLKRYVHPLQSYSPWYYLSSGLPRNYSKADHTAAENLLKVAKGQLELKEEKGITAFALQHGDSTTGLDFEDVVSFFRRPSTYLMRNRLRISSDRADRDVLEDVEALTVEIPSRYKIEIASSPQGQASALDCEAMVEMGKAPDAAAAQSALDELVLLEKEDDEGKTKVTDYGKIQRRAIEFKDGEAYSCAANAVETLAAMKDATPQGFDLELDYQGHAIRMRVVHREVKTCGQTYAFSYDHYKSKDGETSPETLEMTLRHLAGHAGGYSFTSVILRGDGTLRALLPMGQAEARTRLQGLMPILFEPLPTELPDLNVEWKDDKLPQALFKQVVEGLTFVKSAIKRGKTK